MAAALGTAAKKLTKTKIRAISLAGKALLEEDLFDRVCREARGTFFKHLHALVLKYPQASGVICSADCYGRSIT